MIGRSATGGGRPTAADDRPETADRVERAKRRTIPMPKVRSPSPTQVGGFSPVRAGKRSSVRMLSIAGKGLAAAIIAVVLLAGCTSGGDGRAGTTSAAPLTSVAATGEISASPFAAIPSIVERVQPSVVTIETDVGQGSGVIYQADGAIVTNNHVVSGASSVEVVFADGTRSEARTLATDSVVDLAVVKVDGRELPAAAFATDLPKIGELAIAMGDPLGFANSVTAGVVSGLHRSIPGAAEQAPALVDLIQTDAPISPGNSGGALLNASGKVIGINVAYLPPSTGSVSLGFAIPAATVTGTVDQLLANGRAEHAFLGIRPATLTAELARQFNLSRKEGVLAVTVTPDGPAAVAGVQPGDVLTSIDGVELRRAEDLLANLRDRSPGDTVRLTATRGSEQIEIRAQLSDRPS